MVMYHHTSMQYAGRNEKFERTRGRKWLRLRHVVLVEEPVCMVCDRKPSTQVDHIKPVSKGGTDVRDNLQGICNDCHDEKTRKDLGIKKRLIKIGLDGYPVEPRKEGSA